MHGLDVFFVIRSDGTREESCKDGIVTLMAEGKTAQTTIGFSLVSRSEAAVPAITIPAVRVHGMCGHVLDFIRIPVHRIILLARLQWNPQKLISFAES